MNEILIEELEKKDGIKAHSFYGWDFFKFKKHCCTVYLDEEAGNILLDQTKKELTSRVNKIISALAKIKTTKDSLFFREIEDAIEDLCLDYNDFARYWDERAGITPEQRKAITNKALEMMKKDETADGKNDALYLKLSLRNSE